jgi:hypothetical protein
MFHSALLAEIKANGYVSALRDVRRRQALRPLRRKNAAKCVQSAARARLHATLHQCALCADDEVAWADMVHVIPSMKCHRACKTCVQFYVSLALQEGRLHVRCTGAGCQHLLDGQAISTHASAEALKTQEESLRAVHARRAAAESDPEFLEFCSANCRKCPRCAVIIYRPGGCNHMACKCGAHFDWENTAGVKIAPPSRPPPIARARSAPHIRVPGEGILYPPQEASVRGNLLAAIRHRVTELRAGMADADLAAQARPAEVSAVVARSWTLAPQNGADADEQLAAALTLSMEFLLDHPPAILA